jgi:hypothetical protein
MLLLGPGSTITLGPVGVLAHPAMTAATPTAASPLPLFMMSAYARSAAR